MSSRRIGLTVIASVTAVAVASIVVVAAGLFGSPSTRASAMSVDGVPDSAFQRIGWSVEPPGSSAGTVSRNQISAQAQANAGPRRVRSVTLVRIVGSARAASVKAPTHDCLCWIAAYEPGGPAPYEGGPVTSGASVIPHPPLEYDFTVYDGRTGNPIFAAAG